MARLQRSLQERDLTLLVSLPMNNVNLAKAALEEGADGLKVHFNVNHRASGTQFGPLDAYKAVFQSIRERFDGPFGVVPAGSIEEANREDIEQLASVGFDFYSIYAHHLPSFMLYESSLDRTFAINDQYDLSILESARHFGFTGLEASIIPGSEYGAPLSFADILKYRYLVEHARLPVLVPSQRKLVPDDISALSDAGIKAVMLGAVVFGKTEAQLRKAVANFRNAIDKLS